MHVGDDPVAVAANRERLARELGVGADRLVWMDQVHGRRVAVVDGPVEGPLAETDAVVTSTPGLALCVLVADCVPALLADPAAGVVAAVHAGREGVRAGVLLDTLGTAGAGDGHDVLALGEAAGHRHERRDDVVLAGAHVAPW